MRISRTFRVVNQPTFKTSDAMTADLGAISDPLCASRSEDVLGGEGGAGGPHGHLQ